MKGAEELKRFEAELQSSEEARRKFDEAISRLDPNTLQSDSEIFARAASALGYTFTAADIERASAEVQELDLTEMGQVTGGARNPEWDPMKDGVCLISYNCAGCYEKKNIDADGHNEWCYTFWHCFTAFLHTTAAEGEKMACWSDYQCFAINLNVPDA